MFWYETLSPSQVYPNLDSLLNDLPEVRTNECIIFLMNGDSGFGSQMTLLSQTGLYLKSINPHIHCLGHFSRNTGSFKYHDASQVNSFFLYFQYRKCITENVRCHFVQGQLLSNDKFPFIVPQDTDGLNVDAIDVNSRHSSYFRAM